MWNVRGERYMNHRWIAVRWGYNEWEWRDLVPKRKEIKATIAISFPVAWRLNGGDFLVISGKSHLKIALWFPVVPA